jgi:hypothetical protein
VLGQLGGSSGCSGRRGACGWLKQCRAGLDPWLPGDTAGWHCNTTGQHCDTATWHSNTASKYRYATRRHRNSSNVAGTKYPRFNFYSWDTKHNRSELEFTEQSGAWQHDTALNDQSQHHDHPRHFAQRFALWNLAWYCERAVSFRAEYIEPQSTNTWKSGQC